jgi:crotonobetaine/carnitine-CoA ligase
LISIDDHSTIGETFFQAAESYADNAFLAVPANAARSYHPQGVEISYREAAGAVRKLMRVYADAGYGVGHRIGLLLENRPEHLLHKLAMNALGVCCVPLNPDHRAGELAFVIDHARVELVLVLTSLEAQLRMALVESRHQPSLIRFEAFPESLPQAVRPVTSARPAADTPSSVLYTSGTTGRPKGCLLSHHYELAAGAWYATRGGLATFEEGRERLYNPLPLFHVNASIFSFYCLMLKGNCQVQADRFQTTRWWTEVRESRATVVHYLGVVVPMLLSQPACPHDRDHRVRFAIGAGVEPQLHAVFEQRFGFPLIEIWGMTEMVRALADKNAPDGVAGEMLVRHSAASPRKDFFSGYLDDQAATETAWRNGWFHTGDIVTRSADGMLHFVDRRKNIIRRSGENIAAAEVEALLQTHPLVDQVAVLAVPDELREQEVLACIVLRGVAEPDVPAAVRVLFDFCHASLAYYKAPGCIWVAKHIPTTATQKVQKHQIFPHGIDPRTLAGMIDLRALKKRDTAT